MGRVSQPTTKQSGRYDEAVARLESIRQALKVGDSFGAGPAPDLVIGAANAGLDALNATRGQAASAEASRELVDRIRGELEQISRLVLR